MKMNKILIPLIALFCTTSLHAQYKLNVVYSIHDRELISYESITIPQDSKGNTIIASPTSGMFTIPVTINPDGSILFPKKIDNPKTFKDVVENQVASFRFSEGHSSSDMITVYYSESSKNPLQNLVFPATPEPDNLVYFLYLTIFGDTPTTPTKKAITLNATKAVLKAYNQPNALPKGENNRQNIYDFINNGTLFPFEYLLNSDSQKLLEELVLSNSNPATSQSIELLDEIQRILLHIHNSRVLKLALQDIDKSGYDWQAAVNNKVWGDNPRSLIIPKHKQSWDSLMEFITETLPSNPEAVIVEEVLKSFTDRYGGYKYREFGHPESGRVDWARWIKVSLYYKFEEEFIAKFEKYKIVGYPSDSKEEVSELIGCAMLRANLIAYKNNQTIFEPYILRFTEGANKFDITVRQESNAAYANNDVSMSNAVFFKDFISALSQDKKAMKLLDKKKDSIIGVRFVISKDGTATDIKITTPPTLTAKEATIISEAITKALTSLSRWTPAYHNHELAMDWVSFNLSGNSILQNLRSPSNSQISSEEAFFRGTNSTAANSFSIQGRSIVGSLPSPVYNSNTEGRVIVNITVDASGSVVSATYSERGSTTSNSELVNAALSAAKNAKFNTVNNATNQTGTITYNFRLQ